MKRGEKSRRGEDTMEKQGVNRGNKSQVQSFIDSVMNWHIIYHLKADATESNEQDEQRNKFPIFKHVFLNQQMDGKATSSHSSSSKLPSNQTFLDDISSNNESKQQEEYSRYLKQYQTIVKHSRKNEYTSPQQQNKEMKLLINEFLSDIQPQHSSQNTIKVNPTPTKTNNTVRVEKIDLNKFSSNKQNTNKSFNTTLQVGNGTDRSIDKNKSPQEVSPRFINISELKPNTKKNQSQSKSKEKMQIQVVKVQNLGPKPAKKNTYNTILPVSIAKKPMAKQQIKNTQEPPKQISLTLAKAQKGYSSTYTKSKTVKEPNPPSKVQPEKSSRKPLKIQIQIPLQQLSPTQQVNPVLSEHQKIEQFQHQKIIKQVSHAVLSLIRKATSVTSRNP